MGVQPDDPAARADRGHRLDRHRRPDLDDHLARRPAPRVPVGTPVTVTGTAADTGGGRVGGVEVSTDNGATWHRATGRETWTYTFTPSTAGALTLRSRADRRQRQHPDAAAADVTVTVGDPGDTCPCTIWPGTATPAGTDPDTSSVELGVKFRAADRRLHHRHPLLQAATADQAPTSALCGPAPAPSSATVTFTDETASGWQQATFADARSPVTARTRPTSRRTSRPRRYAVSSGYFATAATIRGPLTALQNGTDGRQRRLPLHQHRRRLPQQHLQQRELLGRRRLHRGHRHHQADGHQPRRPPPGATGVPVGDDVTGARSASRCSRRPSRFELRATRRATSSPPRCRTPPPASTATLDPNAALAADHDLHGHAQRRQGHRRQPMDPVTWSFTTETPDTTSRRSRARTPAVGATGVALGRRATATFSEAVQQATHRVRAARPGKRAGARRRRRTTRPPARRPSTRAARPGQQRRPTPPRSAAHGTRRAT